MKKFLFLLTLCLLSFSMQGKVVTFQTYNGVNYLCVIPLPFHVDGVTLSVYGSAAPPGFSFHSEGESFVSTNSGVVTQIIFTQASSSSFQFTTGTSYNSGNSVVWEGRASRVPFRATAVTGMVSVTVDETAADSTTMVCIYQSGRYLYGKPVGEDQPTLVYGNVNNHFVNGDIIKGAYELKDYGYSVEMVPIGTWEKIGQTRPIEPEYFTIEELSPEMIYNYCCFEDVLLTTNYDPNMTMEDETGTLKLYNRFGVEIIPPILPMVLPDISFVNNLIDRILSGKTVINDPETYYVEGFLEVYMGEIELIPTYIEAIHASQSDDYNGDGEVNVADINALIDYILSY